ncbi:Lrp/AsnC family transcriptional regulator [Streptomyces profundus]|uniref:Lrp/AsnC family transcriptional regulator n=1 Tax=Streptomyces profundus TaxID=2867410 RepID=UPI001D168ED1|nr:Lrp/AsnC family transcriptional regulator [Streptomyces sp. MA3_2.13]UED83939.1 Lrp/AsnC family transcriptional regulator [Streptomyces sp. MA3_2.13]
MELDDIDRQIIAQLQGDGRRPFTQIANDLGVSEGLVRYRVQRLTREKVMQVVGIADPLKIGFDLMVMVGIRVTPGMVREVADRVGKFPEASYVASIGGDLDLLLEVVCRDTAHFADLLNNRLHHIEGITSTQTFLILEIHKMAYGWGVPDAPAGQRPEAHVPVPRE